MSLWAAGTGIYHARGIPRPNAKLLTYNKSTTRPSRYVLQLGKCEAQYAERTSITTFSIIQFVWIVRTTDKKFEQLEI